MKPETTPNLPDGAVIAWYVVDPETLQPCIKCESRKEARQYRDAGLICKLVKVH